MKRDMDLVRRILLAIEERPPGSRSGLVVDDVDPAIAFAHIKLLHSAGLIDAKIMDMMGGAGRKNPTGA